MTDYNRGDVGLHGAENSYAGAGFFEAALGLNEAVKENDKVAIGIGSAGMALETLGLVLDPIGSLLTAGIGWLIEHISILRWPLDMMMGDPVGIQAADAAIAAEKKKLEQWAQDHQSALDTLLQEWSGDAADAFKKSMDAVTDQLGALGGYVETAGKNMKIAGGLVGAFRGIVRDLIAMLLATIIKGALIAAALAPVTFGASIAVFIGTTIGAVATALGKVGAKIAQLVKKLGELLSSMAKLGKAGENLTSIKPGSATPSPTPKPTPTPAPTPKPTPPPPPTTPKPEGSSTPPATPKPDPSTTPSSTPKPPEPPPSQPKPPEDPSASGQAKPPEDPSASSQPKPPEDPAASGQPKPPEDPAASAQPKPPEDPAASSQPKPPEDPSASGQPKPPEDPAASGQPKPPEDPAASAQPKPPEDPAASGQPKPPEDPAASSQPNPHDPAQPGQPNPHDPAQSGQPNGNAPATPEPHKPFTDQMTAHIRNKLSQMDGVTPEILQKFDHINNFSVEQLGKVFGPAGAEKFENAMKIMTDPWFGKSGLAGKTIVDMIKGVPASIGNVTGGDED